MSCVGYGGGRSRSGEGRGDRFEGRRAGTGIMGLMGVEAGCDRMRKAGGGCDRALRRAIWRRVGGVKRCGGGRGSWRDRR